MRQSWFRRNLKRLRKLVKLPTFEERIGLLEFQVQRYMSNTPTRDEFDMLKSSLEVTPAMIAEFHTWKAQNPLPPRPLVTVTVSTYNRGRLLTERCIPSILAQTYENLDIVVVGDHCTDDTEERVSRIRDPRLRFYNLPERPIYPEELERRWMVAGTCATNKAYSMARGDCVTHLDDDDEYLPDRIEKLVSFATANGCDFVWHPFWWQQNDGGWLLRESESFACGQVTNSSVLYRSWFLKFPSDINSHMLLEPGDWNRFRKIKYIHPVCMRYPEPLLKHYREGTRKAAA